MGKPQRRKIKTFAVAVGYNGDDFIYNMKTVRIHYTLNRQTKRRAIQWRVNPQVIANDPKLLAKMLYTEFKWKLNIFHS